MKKKFSMKNFSGFSIIEAMVALGLASGAIGLMVQNSSNQIKKANSIVQVGAIEDIRLYFRESIDCVSLYNSSQTVCANKKYADNIFMSVSNHNGVEIISQQGVPLNHIKYPFRARCEDQGSSFSYNIQYSQSVGDSRDWQNLFVVPFICKPPASTLPPLRWVQAQDNVKTHLEACTAAGAVPAFDSEGMFCATGELKPYEPEELDPSWYTYGTWWPDSGDLNPTAAGNVLVDNLKGKDKKTGRVYCYRPGQKQDQDETDLIIAWFCDFN